MHNGLFHLATLTAFPTGAARAIRTQLAPSVWSGVAIAATSDRHRDDQKHRLILDLVIR